MCLDFRHSIRAAAGPSISEPSRASLESPWLRFSPRSQESPRSSSGTILIRRNFAHLPSFADFSALIRRRPRHTDQTTSFGAVVVLLAWTRFEPPSRGLSEDSQPNRIDELVGIDGGRIPVRGVFREMRHDRGSMLGISNGQTDVSISGKEPLEPRIEEAAPIKAGPRVGNGFRPKPGIRECFYPTARPSPWFFLDRFECRWFLRLIGRVAGRNPADRIHYSDRSIAELSSNLA